MLHQYFQQKDVHPFFNYMERPVKEIMELNARTMQRFAYLMPAEMLMVKKPEQMMEKNIELLMESSQTALNYMQNIFGIMERHMLSNLDTMAQKTKSSMSHSEKRSASSATAKKSVKQSNKKDKTVASKAKPQSGVSKSITAKSAKSSPMVKSSSAAKKQSKPAAAMKSKESVQSTMKPQMVAQDMKKPSGTLPSHFSSSPSSMKPAVGPQTTK